MPIDCFIAHPNPLQVIISHNEEFVTALCKYMPRARSMPATSDPTHYSGPEIWNIEEGRMMHKGKIAVVEDAFAVKSPKGSGSNTPALSRTQTPAASAAATPAGSGAEDNKAGGTSTPPIKKKKKLTRNQIKAQEERRRIRKINWLTFGGPKPEDTDSD